MTDKPFFAYVRVIDSSEEDDEAAIEAPRIDAWCLIYPTGHSNDPGMMLVIYAPGHENLGEFFHDTTGMFLEEHKSIRACVNDEDAPDEAWAALAKFRLLKS